MADVNRGKRPLSPFMIGPYYRPQLNSITSILTRITGISLALGAVLVVWWFLAASTSPEYFEFADRVMTSWLGSLVMIGSAWALWYHALAGLRHLFWDQGIGMEMASADRLSWAVIIGSVVLTLLTIVMV